MTLPITIHPHALCHPPKFAFYFRYPLHRDDFREIRIDRHRRGYFAAKPLYGKLTAAGKVDRSAGFNGEVAVIFIPSPARSLKHSELLVTCMRREEVALPNGKRNWPAIRRAAEKAILATLECH